MKAIYRLTIAAGLASILAVGATAQQKTQINGAGATFPNPIYSKWFDEYNKAHPNVQINYQSVGSGAGIRQLTNQTVFFGATDGPMTDEQMLAAPGKILHFPTVLGAVVPVYNIPNVKAELKFSGPLLADIFLGKITKWNDPAIAKLNEGMSLPATDITVAHRADGSGTTQNFTEYLTMAAKKEWKLKSGSTVEWPGDTQAGQGNAGVAQIVKSTKGAIAYVDLSDAKASGLKFATIKNRSGHFVEPTSAAASAAGQGIEVKDNLIFSALDAKGDKAYPITAQTWVIVYAKQIDRAKGDALKAYLTFLLKDGQALLDEIDYAPLPRSLQDKAVKQIDKIRVAAHASLP